MSTEPTDTTREDGIIQAISAFQTPRGYALSLAWHDIIAEDPKSLFQLKPTTGPLLPIGVGPAVVVHLSKTQTTELFHRMNKRGFYLDAFHGTTKQLKQHAEGRVSHAYVFDDRRGLPQNTLFVAPPVYGPVFIQYGPKTYDTIDDAVKRSSTQYLSEMLVRNGAI
jgi:hypothetical protein